jgi:adenosylcobinamide kinase/adenosylcobinamide-phosphate guanylyltransferase
MRILVLGGARSGKSRYAEQLIMAHPSPWIYMATAQAFDDEMRARIATHRGRRTAGWQTLDTPLDLPNVLSSAPDHPVLVDCLTLWLTNIMLGGHDREAALRELETAFGQRKAPTVLVTNEVGLGIVPDNALARSFQDTAGVLNQCMAAVADQVWFVAAGLPLRMKG